MATMIAHITVKPDKEAEWEAICRTLHAATHAEEPGVVRYEYWRGSEPRSYYAILSFVDHRAFIVHQASDHHEDASPQIRDCLETFRLEFVDPVGGASEFPPTEHQSAPDGANDLTRKYTDRFAAQVADWWRDLR